MTDTNTTGTNTTGTTTTGTAIDVEATVERYFEAWNAAPPARAAAVARVFSPGSYYCDGAAEATGADAIVAMMDAVAAQFPGSRFRRISAVDTHHLQARFAWTLEASDGTTIIDGLDAMRLTPQGRIDATLGFFGVALPG